MGSSKRRIIGESPPLYGGKTAYSAVMPNHTGECVLRYRENGCLRSIRLRNYQIARTAAIRAIFTADNDIDDVWVLPVTSADLKHPFFESALAWLANSKVQAA